MQREHFLLQNNGGKYCNIKSKSVPWHPLRRNTHTHILPMAKYRNTQALTPQFKLYGTGSARQKMCRVTPRQRLIFLWYIQYFTCSTLSGEYICLAFKNVMYCAIHHRLIYWVRLCSLRCASRPGSGPRANLQHCCFQSRGTISFGLNQKQAVTLTPSQMLGKVFSSRSHWNKPSASIPRAQTPATQTQTLLHLFYRMKNQLWQLSFPFATLTCLHYSRLLRMRQKDDTDSPKLA